MAYRTRDVTFERGILLFERACFAFYILSLYNEELIRSVSMKHTDGYDPDGSYEPSAYCNTLCPEAIMRCTLRMCSEYGLLTMLTVCTERMIRQLLLTVPNSAAVVDMIG